ncbi:hypothetical protein AMTR_s00135p00047990 [Amborella trichopoda]|uniref:Protein kinase domain-containing protein n=1 Tax=Amborella trichopoda TaxID=13333 RepID=W1P4P7_AMBTC|nr:hypothetical protein AMTR_s00135p00047990 [Amborella trichopoda]
MFSDDLNLPKSVDKEYPSNLLHIVDRNLLTENYSHENANSSRQEYVKSSLQILSAIIYVALLCTKKRPDERINMRDSVSMLKSINTPSNASLIVGAPYDIFLLIVVLHFIVVSFS